MRGKEEHGGKWAVLRLAYCPKSVGKWEEWVQVVSEQPKLKMMQVVASAANASRLQRHPCGCMYLHINQ